MATLSDTMGLMNNSKIPAAAAAFELEHMCNSDGNDSSQVPPAKRPRLLLRGIYMLATDDLLFITNFQVHIQCPKLRGRDAFREDPLHRGRRDRAVLHPHSCNDYRRYSVCSFSC